MRYLLLFLFLCGCHRHYNPSLPKVEIPSAWKEPLEGTQTFAEIDHFWTLFEDPVLATLEQEAIAGNFDIQIATSRIDQARAIVAKKHSARLPHIEETASFNEDETLLNPPSFGSPTKHLERVNQQQYNLLTDFSYEIDLWGKLKAQESSARHHLKAAEWEYEFVYQTLVTDVAIRYFSCRTLEAERLFLEQALILWKETIDINESRVKAGLDPELDLSRAKLELALVEGEIEVVKEQYAIQEHALATLLGKPASCWSLPSGKLPQKIPQLPSLLPSDIMLRRADIKQHLALVSAGKSEVEAALRNYFPSFSISTTLGLSSPFISDFFKWQARYWGYLLSAAGTLFDGGSKNADLHFAKARFFEHFASYQKTVNLAFQDVEDSLSTLQSLHLHLESGKRAADAAGDTSLLAKEQFDSGLISYLLVADAERASIQTQRQLLILQGRQIVAWIRLVKAFGIELDSKKDLKI